MGCFCIILARLWRAICWERQATHLNHASLTPESRPGIMHRAAPRGSEPIVSVYRDLWRVVDASARPAGRPCLAVLALVRRALIGRRLASRKA